MTNMFSVTSVYHNLLSHHRHEKFSFNHICIFHLSSCFSSVYCVGWLPWPVEPDYIWSREFHLMCKTVWSCCGESRITLASGVIEIWIYLFSTQNFLGIGLQPVCFPKTVLVVGFSLFVNYPKRRWLCVGTSSERLFLLIEELTLSEGCSLVTVILLDEKEFFGLYQETLTSDAWHW